MSSEATVKKNIQKLQRAIVDGLEDVKAQDIQVFNTEGLSPLFERVVIATGSSNRQTKALAASVRDAVREAGFDKPRTEGEENGEWIIVDCGPAVVHVMQPGIRQYYRLEDIWGETPVRLKSGTARQKAALAAAQKANAESAAGAKARPAARSKVSVEDTTEPKAPARRRSTAAADKSTTAAPSPARKPAANGAVKAPAKTAAKTAAPRAAAKTVKSSTPAKAPARKAAPKVAVVKVGTPAKKAAAKPAAKSTAKPAPRKTAAKKKA